MSAGFGLSLRRPGTQSRKDANMNEQDNESECQGPVEQALLVYTAGFLVIFEAWSDL